MFLRRKRHTETESDETLAQQAGSGDHEALGILFNRYAHLLFGVGLKYLKNDEKSKDMVMDLFADLPRLLSSHEVEHFRPWLHTVMRNKCLQHFRKNGKMTRVELDEKNEMEHDRDELQAAELRELELERLEASIAELKGAQRECITLFYLKKLSYQQVAERTNYTLEQVRSHLQNGRRNLKIKLTRHADQH